MTDTTISMLQWLLVKGTRDKEKKEKTKKQTQQLSCSSLLKQRDRGHERTNNKSASEINKNKKNSLQCRTFIYFNSEETKKHFKLSSNTGISQKLVFSTRTTPATLTQLFCALAPWFSFGQVLMLFHKQCLLLCFPS